MNTYINHEITNFINKNYETPFIIDFSPFYLHPLYKFGVKKRIFRELKELEKFAKEQEDDLDFVGLESSKTKKECDLFGLCFDEKDLKDNAIRGRFYQRKIKLGILGDKRGLNQILFFDENHNNSQMQKILMKSFFGNSVFRFGVLDLNWNINSEDIKTKEFREYELFQSSFCPNLYLQYGNDKNVLMFKR